METIVNGLLGLWLEKNAALICLLCVGVTFFVLIFFINANLRLKRYRFLLKGNDAKNLEATLLNLAEKTNVTHDRLIKMEDKFTTIKVYSEKHIQNWGLVRFKAFQNTGGDQSFALALLDASGDGVVISSIFGREESRVYCKPVTHGSSNYPLSQEEKEAIHKAFGEKRAI